MLIDTFLTALRAYSEAEQIMQDVNLDEVERELAIRHLNHAKLALVEALDDYIDTRVDQRLIQRELTTH